MIVGLLMIIYLNWSNSNTELVLVCDWLDKIHRLDRTLGQELIPFPCLSSNLTARTSLWRSLLLLFSSRKNLQKQALLNYAGANKSQSWQIGEEVNNKVNFKVISAGMSH